MKTLSQHLETIESYLSQEQLPGEPGGLYVPILYSLEAGGKRLRPLLTLLSCELFGGDGAQALPCAAAMEVFHNFTLLHDDVMDNAPMRRGKPSVHAKWSSNVAILSGDAMLVYSYQLIGQTPAPLLGAVLAEFNRMAMQVFEGQQYDMDFESRADVSVEEYMHMIELKTSVLLAGSAVIGAMIGGAVEAQCRKLRRFAVELGLAFQLQDDLLDSYGDSRLGKAIGGDILEGKKTFLAITACSRVAPALRRELQGLHLDERLSSERKIARAREIYEMADARRLTEQRIGLHFERSLAALEELGMPSERTRPLRDFAAGLIGRSR